ncbi:unnamed protein product [Clonostachys rosea f. rosea IK726]|jgi:hypothetical protein|uniref:Uncharacterized protein n=2 Tax=Bionectria ochroleuca TaxID=29856 RepID=A0A8H7TTY4_BIOOC|nr:unnamed protein product [Clonostachys rosea f. rosea IK726]
MVNKMGTREVEYNCRAPVWLFKDAENNIFQSPQKNLSKKMIIRYKTGHRAGRAVLKTTKRSIRAPKRIWADAHGIAIFRSHYNHRGERLWVIDASDTVPVFMDVVSLDTRRTFRTPINTICFVPQLQTVDETGVRHYITPVAENWFVQWPVGQPQLVERKEGPLPDEPTTISSAASRKQSFRDEWATRGGGGSQLCALEREWEDDREEEGVKYLQEFADASDMGEQLVASFDLPMRPVA